jgi:PPOX class probable F420-dependent enzyme
MFVSVPFAWARTAPTRLGRWNNRRVRLTEEEARTRLAGARVARLATAGADGQPYLVPVTFAVDDDLIYITVDHKPKTTTKLKRLRNIRENPRVALLADHYADDWDALWWVRVDGWASIVEDERAVTHPIDALAGRYEQYRQDRPGGPVIVIQADNWTGWSST